MDDAICGVFYFMVLVLNVERWIDEFYPMYTKFFLFISPLSPLNVKLIFPSLPFHIFITTTQSSPARPVTHSTYLA